MNSEIECADMVCFRCNLLMPWTGQMIAKHVMNIHMNRPGQNTDDNGENIGEIDIDKMRRYISYCKAYVSPLLK